MINNYHRMIDNFGAMSFYSVNITGVVNSNSDFAKQLSIAKSRNSLAAISAGANITTAAITRQFPFGESAYY
ncbi:MAG TPA: hypothetical protein VFJ51_09865 [Nitrososphaeraceae archaeon]|nr:hypothetical protein [Nitrososphaeraceae archaeon]